MDKLKFDNFIKNSFDNDFMLTHYIEERKTLKIEKTIFNIKSKKYFDIVVDNIETPRYLSLFFLDQKIGFLTLTDFDTERGLFLSVKEVLILDNGFRGLGLCQELYIFALNIKNNLGLVSFIPNRIDENCIPNIYKKFNTFILDDYEYILK
jgi:hypothetical protein